MDSALGETNVTSVDRHQIDQSGMAHVSVLYYCDDALHIWKAENWRGIHLCLQEPRAPPVPPGWHCRDDHLHHLSWVGPAGKPLWAFLRFAPLETSSISQFPTPPLCVSSLPVGSCRFFVQMSDSAPGGDSIPPDVMITFWFFCFWWWQIASLLLCFSCSLGNLTPLPKLGRFAIILARLRKLVRKAFLFLAFQKMVSFFLWHLTSFCRRSGSSHFEGTTGKKQIWHVVEVKRRINALPILIAAFV